MMLLTLYVLATVYTQATPVAQQERCPPTYGYTCQRNTGNKRSPRRVGSGAIDRTSGGRR